MKLINKKTIIFLSLLILCIQSWTKADDISDFELEGMSIGDSALNFFTKKEIIDNIKDWYPDKTYTYSAISKKNFDLYDKIGFFYKTNDRDYKIVSLSAYLWCKENVNNCLETQEEVKKDFSILFRDLKQMDNVFDYPVSIEIGKNSKAYQTIFEFENGDQVVIETKDWSSDAEYTDNFSINLDTKAFSIWLVDNS